MKDVGQFLMAVSRDVDLRLDTLVPSVEIEPVRLHEAIRWSLFAGGKRFRPAITIAVGEALGSPRIALLTTAASIEMVHTYSLIHDDLPAMDDDDLRRGKPTCHVRFDEATAILAGDVLQTLAFKALATDDSLSAGTRLSLINVLATAAGTPGGMVAGQQLDLEAEGNKNSLTPIAEIHAQKTGALITAAAVSGAIIAAACDDMIEVVRSFGQRLGLLFQVTDDLLDVTQATPTLGKTAGKDANAGKATYVSHHGMDETVRLANSIRDEAVAEIRELPHDTGMLEKLVEFVLNRKN